LQTNKITVWLWIWSEKNWHWRMLDWDDRWPFWKARSRPPTPYVYLLAREQIS